LKHIEIFATFLVIFYVLLIMCSYYAIQFPVV